MQMKEAIGEKQLPYNVLIKIYLKITVRRNL